MKSLETKAIRFVMAFVLISGITGISNSAQAALKPCTNQQKALMLNLGEQSLIVSQKIATYSQSYETLKYKYSEIQAFGNINDPSSVKLRQDVEFWQARLQDAKAKANSLDSQKKSLQSKCSFSESISKSKNTKNKKLCSAAEKRALNAIISNIQFIQSNKRNWNSKLEIAQAYARDYFQPLPIQAQANMDARKYGGYYEAELAKESLAIEQFNLINDLCLNSGLSIPALFTPARVAAASPKPVAPGVSAIPVVSKAYGDGNGTAPFIIKRNPDSSFSVSCKLGANVIATTPPDLPVNLDQAQLFVIGNLTTIPEAFINVIQPWNQIKKWIITPEKLKVKASWDDRNLYNLSGKYISLTSGSSNICAYNIEQLGDLKSTFASDIVSVGFLLKLSSESSYWYLGGAALA